MNKRLHIIISLTVLLAFCTVGVSAQRNRLIAGPEVTLVDGTSSPWNQLQPGDTLFFRGGPKPYLLIRNFTGSFQKPICFMNIDGPVVIHTNHYYGIAIKNCRYIRLSGTGDTHNYYGFRITKVANGAGLSIGELSSFFEVDHIRIDSVPIAGVYAKTDPDCSFTSLRGKFTQYNTIFHDNYISNTGDEGFYIGSSFYGGETINCNGNDTLLYPSLLSGVRVYNNIVRYTGWDGIQVGSASTNCQIFNNLVMFDSQAEVNWQMSGILIGGGSQCDCYNNYIYKGKGDGIESLGLGDYRIFNNVIVEAGASFKPSDPTKMKYGIYCNDNSARPNASFSILFNNIISPKSNGIRFSSVVTKKNLIASNVIINPGLGLNAYVVVTNPSCEVSVKNNYNSMTVAGAGFLDTTYRIMSASPLINAAYPDTRRVCFDYFNHPRPIGSGSDIGICEYTPGRQTFVLPPEYADTTIFPSYVSTFVVDPVPMPEPVRDALNISYTLDSDMKVELDVYDIEGDRIFHDEVSRQTKGEHKWTVNSSAFPEGLNLFTMRSGSQAYSGRFYKSK